MNQLIVCPYSGFSNRLKSLVSASLLDKDYKVYWPPEDFCGLSYGKIFSDTFREIDHIPSDSIVLNSWRFELPVELSNLIPTGFSDCSTGYKGIEFPGDKHSRTIDFEYLKIPRPILAAILKQFNQLRFNEEIVARVNARLREMPDHFVGVHARTWDDEPERTQKWFNFADFVKICSRFQGKELFVTSDDPAFITTLSRALNKKLITTKRSEQRTSKTWHQNSPDEMLDDLVELLVLSKASQLILTAMSTYSEVAWYIGGCTQEVYFADPDFQYKGRVANAPRTTRLDDSKLNTAKVHWVEVAGDPSYFLALIPGHHAHLDSLSGGTHAIGDYIEKYRSYMKGSEPRDYMIDVGANLGLSAFPVASIGRRVVTFEPVAENVDAMKKTISRNRFGNVTLVECAVSSQVGETYIYIPQGRADNASFGEDVANANVFSPEVLQFLVPTETIDHWFKEHSKEFTPGDAKLLKIDVQGYETEVIIGAKEFIAVCRPFEKLIIEFEFDPKLTQMAGYSTLSLLELIHSYGLEIFYNNTQISSDNYADFCRQDTNCDLLALFCPTGNSAFNHTHKDGIMSMGESLYGQVFYNSQVVGSLQSAQIYLYHLFSIWGVPESAVDIGCGRGAWLATCSDFGVKRVVGIDGDWNSKEAMLDPRIEFYPANLEKEFTVTGPFDLAISLEVAEHLRPESSDAFVESLSSLSDVVLFGAAFTGQPGVNHINTRPHSFWAKKFFDRGYVLFDLFRPIFWNDERVEACYRQNTFLYVKPGNSLYLTLVNRGYAYDQEAEFIDCVHPVLYLGLLDEFNKLQNSAGTEPQDIPLDGQLDAVQQHIENAGTLVALNRLGDAADTYGLALAQEPDNPELLLRFSHVLLRMKRYQECFHHACHFLRMVNDVSFGYYLAGHAAREIGRWQDSRTYLLRAVELDPSHLYARVLCCMSIFTVCMNQAETLSMMSTYADELNQLASNTTLETAGQINDAVDGIGAMAPFFLPYLGCNVKNLQLTYGSWVCNVMAAKYPQFTHSLPQRASNGKIKIGIVSNYFHNHSNWKIPIRGWLEQLDRQLFSVHCFYTGEISDQATETARLLADTFRQSTDIDELISDIYGEEFDVLIYPGIGMDTVTLKLAALRLAPVQCASWGHPVTTGMPTMDYYISSDLMEPPDGDEDYTEKLVRLPNLSIWYEPAELESGVTSNLEIQGLSGKDVVFLCCQNLLKYLPRYDYIFPAIARCVNNARFVFISSQVSELTEKFTQRLGLAFQSRGLNAADYVSVIPPLDGADFSALNARADIFLDSIEWSGCNTVFESLPHNKPIVTMPGAFMRGRHAYAILKMMGVEETIAANEEEYISIAVRLAKDTQWREDISTKTARNEHKIFRDNACIAALEKFLIDVSGRHHGGVNVSA